MKNLIESPLIDKEEKETAMSYKKDKVEDEHPQPRIGNIEEAPTW